MLIFGCLACVGDGCSRTRVERSGISANLRKFYNERVDPVPEGPNESSLAQSAWKQDKSRPVPEGRLICLTSARDIRNSRKV